MSKQENSSAAPQDGSVQEEVLQESVQDEAVLEGDLISDVTVEELQEQLEAALTQIGGLTDQALRAQAETLNIRRRAEQDVEKAHKFALDKFVKDLLPIMDSMEHGVVAAAGDEEKIKALREGMEITQKMFVDCLGKYQVEQLDPAGEPFDPQLHQAMTMVPSPNVEPNTVLDVMQKGYLLNGRLVRPAMVVVSKA